MKRSYTYLKGLLTLALAAFTGWMWAGVTSSFGVNFRTAEAQDIPADTAAGFTKSDYAQPTTWANLNGGNGKQDITVGGATLNVTWYSRGTYNSGADTSTLDGKLLYNYLDDTVNNGRQKAAVKITGLPADKQYAVALILSGDANNDGFNGKYSPVWINGETYSYVDGALVTGDAAVAATTWGNRRAANNNGPTTFIEGTNVMFVEGVTGSELIITSAMDNQNVSRLTIAGVQVWVTDTTVTAPAVTAPTDSDVISVNFHSGDGAAADGDGLVAAKHWHNTTGENGTIDSLTVVNGDDSVASSGTLTYKSKNTWGYGTNVTTNFLKGYLDDGAHDDVVGATITATVPFENYSVIVYMATDTAGQFKPVIVNGTLYAGSTTLSSVGYADAKPSMMQNTSVCNWGTCQTATAAYGVNTLRVDGLSGNLTIQAGNDQTYNGIRNRGGIAAIQIVNTGDSILSDIQKIDWSDKTAEELKVSELPELTKAIVELTLPAGATLIVDTALPADHSIAIVGDNVTVNITNWDIEKSAVESLISGATVTTAYTDTIGVEIDGVTYSYIFRGTTDATYGTVANWYTGKRVMGDQTKWFSVSGDVAPGVGGNMWHHMLLDGEMMDSTNVTVGEDGYKTISATVLEGWNLGYFVRNGVHLNAATLNKIQNGSDFTAVWRVDDTSKITIGARGNSQHNNLANYYIDNEEGMVFTEFDIADANYYFDEDGSVKLDGVSGTQTIKAITLDIGTVAEGRKVVSRKVIGFNSSTATYTVEEGAVTTSVASVTAEAAEILQTVGQYKFEKKDDGYYVSFVAYAETDEIGAMNTWTKGEDALWATAGNWSSGFVPAEGATATISITEDTTITIPAEGVSVSTLLVSGEGTLTIAGGKITATKILAEANIAADETTLALAEMDIEAGKTVTYTTTTTDADPDTFGSVHALSLKAMTGAGTFVKKGTGVIALFATAAEPAIDVQQGAIYVREVPTTAMNIAAKAGTEIRLAAWLCDFNNNANSLKLEGGAQLTLANGSGLAGSITIAEAAETPAKICGMSFGAATVSAAITGAGKVEFADGGSFGDATKYPCDGATTYSGVISGDLQVIISDTSAVTFTANNTYTGGTVIAEGVTVSVSNTNTIFGSGNVTGAGTVKIAGGTYNNLSLAQYTDANTTIEIPADNTVTGYFNSATWTCAAKIQLDGTLSLTNGFAAGKYTFTGPWTGAGSFSLSNANPADVVRITGDISGFTGDISVAGARAITFCAESTAFNQKYSGKICVHGDYAYTAKVNGTWSAPVVVENGAKIGGEGSIDNTLTFNAGSIIDGAVTATGDATLNGAVTVSGEAGATVLTCANAASLDLTKFAAPAGLKCVAEDGAVKLAVAKKTNFVVTVGEETVNCETVAEALDALAANGGSLQIAADADPEALALTEKLTIAADTTIDLNGKDLTSTADPAIHVTGGTLTLTGEGSITAPYVVIQQGTKNAGLTTKVVVGEDVLLTSFRTEGEDWDGDNVVLLYGKATLESAGVLLTYSKGWAAIQGSGGDAGADTAITITGGQVVNSGDDVAIYQPQAGKLTIEGGVISGTTAIYAKAGTISITGGTISGTGEKYAYGENHNGCGPTGDALVIDETAGYADLSVSITGGTFTSDNAEAVASYAGAGQTAATGVVKADATATFNTDVSDLCEAGYKTEANDEGIYGVVVDPAYGKVAKIGDTYYTTFADALADAQADDTITLLADVTINSRLDIAQNVTIDLNGQTIAETMEDQFGAIYVKKGATLTIAATNGGEITTDGGIVIGNYGTVIVNGGTIAAGEDAETDVSIYNFYYQADWYGTTTINGGTVARIWNCGVATLVDGTITDVDNSGAMEITADAEVTNIILRDGTDAPGIEGAGTLTAPAGLTVTTLDGQKAVYADGKYTVVDIVYVAQVGETKYETLQAAVEAGDTITLLADVEVASAGITITSDTTIDLAGKNITSDGDVFIVTGGTLTITGEGNITANTDNAGTACALWANGGNAVINGGTWSCGGDTETTDVAHQNDTIYTKNGGKVTITGGTFEYTENVWTLNENDNNRGTISIKGGKFKKFNPANNTIEGTGTNFCAAGYTAVAEGEDYTVKAIVIHEELVDSPAAEAIKEVMAEAGVAEITDYSIITTGSGTPADVADVAAVLEVFEVTPTVDANGVLSVAYEFGISEMTNAGDTITITAGVTGAEYRADVTVAFYADGTEIGTATTTADSTTVSITDISATDINGKKITVKAIK